MLNWRCFFVIAVGLSSSVACEKRVVGIDAGSVEDGRPAGDGPALRDGQMPDDGPVVADAARVNQGPITFVALNNSDASVFIDNRYGDGYCFGWEIEMQGQWEERTFGGYGCTEECTEDNRGEPCLLLCEEPLPSVQQIRPGSRFEFVWNGDEFQIIHDHCSNGPCYRRVDPQAGRYQVRICVYPEYACLEAPCPDPTDAGVIAWAEVRGDRSCFETDFDIPYHGDTVQITIDLAL